MQCYICETQQRPTAALMRATSEAVGVCRNCGIGLCATHGHRSARAGAPLLCADCVRSLSDAGPVTALGLPQATRELVGRG